MKIYRLRMYMPHEGYGAETFLTSKETFSQEEFDEYIEYAKIEAKKESRTLNINNIVKAMKVYGFEEIKMDFIEANISYLE